jgi:hypothetical protein
MNGDPQPAPSMPFGDAIHALLGYLPPRMQAMGRGAYGAAEHAYNLPQRMIESAGQYAQTGEYNPAPAVDLMGMLAGGGMRAAEPGSIGVFGGAYKGAGKPGVTLQAAREPLIGVDYHGRPTESHAFDIMDNERNRVGGISSTWAPNQKQLNIDYIRSAVPGQKPEASRVLGTYSVKSMIRALQEHFPELEQITGTRISGARKKAGVVQGGPRGFSTDPTTGRYYTDAVVRIPKAPKR